MSGSTPQGPQCMPVKGLAGWPTVCVYLAPLVTSPSTIVMPSSKAKPRDCALRTSCSTQQHQSTRIVSQVNMCRYLDQRTTGLATTPCGGLSLLQSVTAGGHCSERRAAWAPAFGNSDPLAVHGPIWSALLSKPVACRLRDESVAWAPSIARPCSLGPAGSPIIGMMIKWTRPLTRLTRICVYVCYLPAPRL